MKKVYSILLLLVMALSMQSCEIDLSAPNVCISLESSESDKTVVVENATIYIVPGDIYDIPGRLILDVKPGETVNLKISKRKNTVVKELTLYYFDIDLNIHKLPFEKVLVSPDESGLYPVVLEGNISNGNENRAVNLLLYLKVVGD